MLLAVDDLLPGFVLGNDVIGNNGQVLLARGVDLTVKYINRLKDMSVKQVIVSTQKEEVATPPPKDVISAELEHKTRSQMREIFKITLDRKALPAKALIDLSNTINDVVKSIFDAKGLVVGDIQAVKDHDDYTHGHSWAVFVSTLSLMKQAIEERLIWNADFFYMNSLGLGAVLHDIGKVCVRREVLNKKERLSDAEFEEIKQHAYLGFEEMRKNKFYTPMMRAIALQHHQKWDGTGYGPKSGVLLKGESIPFQIRVVSLADAYDALVSDRPYRKGVTCGEAVTILERDSGTHFDAKIVPLLRTTFPELARGSILLLKNGYLVHVIDPALFSGEISAEVVGSIFGTEISQRRIDSLDRADIIARGNSIEHIATHIRKIMSETKISIKANPPFDKLLKKILMENKICFGD